jgi:hypothetical protein
VAAALHRFRAVELGGRPWSEGVLDSFQAWTTRQWTLPPEQVALVPDALVATFRYLERTGEIDGAMAWNLRKRLAATRERFLAEASDPARFGPAKAVVTAAMQAGVDLTDRAALEAFLAREGERIVAGLNLPMPGSPGPVRGGAGRRVGRNDPCPCGSGKKYKKCCGQQD